MSWFVWSCLCYVDFSASCHVDVLSTLVLSLFHPPLLTVFTSSVVSFLTLSSPSTLVSPIGSQPHSRTRMASLRSHLTSGKTRSASPAVGKRDFVGREGDRGEDGVVIPLRMIGGRFGEESVSFIAFVPNLFSHSCRAVFCSCLFVLCPCGVIGKYIRFPAHLHWRWLSRLL